MDAEQGASLAGSDEVLPKISMEGVVASIEETTAVVVPVVMSPDGDQILGIGKAILPDTTEAIPPTGGEERVTEETRLLPNKKLSSNAAALSAQPKSGDARAFGNILKSFIGSGVLGLPYAFLQGGMLAGIIFFPLICLICGFTMFMLVDTKRFCAEKGVCTVGRAAFGRIGGILVNTALLSYQIGCCCTYQIFISSNLNIFVPSIDARVWMCITLALFIVVAMNRTLKFLAPFSHIANSFICGALVFFLIYAGATRTEAIDWADIKLFDWAHFPLFFGIAIYAFEGTGLVIPIEHTMIKPSHYKRTLALGLVIVCTLYCAFGGFSYMMFGSHTDRLITKNFPDGAFKVVVIILFMIALFVTYQLMIFPVFEAFDRMRWVKRIPGRVFYVKSCLIRATLVSLTVLLAALIPNFPDFVSLVGASAGTCISFLFPPLLQLKIMWKVIPLWRKVINISVVALAVAIFAICTVTTIIDIINEA